MKYFFAKLRSASFSTQVMFLFVIPFSFAFVAGFILMVEMFGDTTTENYLRQGKFISRVLANQSALSILYGSAENAKAVSETILALPLVDGVAIYDASSELIYQAGVDYNWTDTRWRLVNSDSPILEKEDDFYWQFVATVATASAPNVYDAIAMPIENSREVIGNVRLLFSKGELGEVRSQFIGNALVLSLFITLVFILVVPRLTAKLISPLKDLSARMFNLHDGDMTRFVSKGYAAKEIVQISAAFNEMMLMLEQREKELKQARDTALEFAQIKSQFAANVSHEIRTPINGILGTFNLLVTMDLPEEQLEYVQLAQESGEQLLSLVNDILDFSKMSEGQMKVDFVEMDLQLILEDIVALQSGTPQAEGIDLVCLYDAGTPTKFLGDPSRTRQLFNNLVSNAVKFTDAGEVKIQVRLAEEKQNKFILLINVVDSGMGISPEDQVGIFDPYSQRVTAGRTKHGGTGLGLAISKQIVDLLGGQISVKSEVGKGSEFILKLPFKRALTTSYEPLPIKDDLMVLILSAPGSQTILLENFCQRYGLRCRWLPNPHSALEYLTNNIQSGKLDGQYGEVWVLVNWPRPLGGLLDQFSKTKASAHIETLRFVSFQRQVLGVFNEQHAVFDAYINKPVRRVALENLFEQSCGGEPSVRVAAGRQSSAHVHKFERAVVLVVEDNTVNQKVALATLDNIGITAELVADGAEAVEAVRNKTYSLILMDCEMPVMNGYEATRQIRKLSTSYSSMPIVAWTANVTPVEKQRCIDCGMDDFLAKPFKREQLVEILTRWLS